MPIFSELGTCWAGSGPPYVWRCPPDVESARRAGAGSGVSEHALLVKELRELGIECLSLLLMDRWCRRCCARRSSRQASAWSTAAWETTSLPIAGSATTNEHSGERTSNSRRGPSPLSSEEG